MLNSSLAKPFLFQRDALEKLKPLLHHLMKGKTAHRVEQLFGLNKMVKEQNGYRIAYDELADTLYLSLGQPKIATESYLDENYILVRKVADKICGITIDGFLDRHEDNSWRDELITTYLPEFDTHVLDDLTLLDVM